MHIIRNELCIFYNVDLAATIWSALFSSRSDFEECVRGARRELEVAKNVYVGRHGLTLNHVAAAEVAAAAAKSGLCAVGVGSFGSTA